MNLLSDRNNLHPKERPLADSVLRLIWREKRTSRADIARQMGLSRSTVSEIIEKLLKTGLIAEVGSGKSSGGRRPIVLEFQDEARCLLGVDLGATHISVALTDLRGNVLIWKEKKHPVRTDPEGTRALVMSLCESCLEDWGQGAEKLIRIGVAVPSPVDPLNPKMLSEVVIPAWQGESGLEELQNRFHVPVHVDNDANLGALAEHWWGAGSDINDFIYIKLAHGIGAGYVLNGEIYRGAGGVAGEMGHFPIDPRGEKCVCGLNGCLATFVSLPALTKRVQSLTNKYPDSILTGKDVNYELVEKAAIERDKMALEIVNEVAEYLSRALTGWFNLMNPNLAILGGGLSSLGELLLKPIRDRIQNNTLVSKAAVDIRTGMLGPRAVAIGAATLALEAIFSDNDIAEHNIESAEEHAQ